MSASHRFVGIVLMILGVGILFESAAGAAPHSKKPSSRPTAVKTSTAASYQPVYHTVNRGQTLYSIARQYGVPLKSLATANKIANPAKIRAGSRLVIPGARVIQPEPSQTLTRATAAHGSPVTLKPDTEHVFLTAPLDWPIDGQFVSAFARPRRGHRHKGIDIKSKEGSPFRAVADGMVTRVEEHSGSYGRLIVIEHENGMQSYYGHNKKNLVQVGQTVAAEQTIGLVGHSGNATCDHLHFELHVRGQAVDPMTMLASLPNGPRRANPRETLVTSSALRSGEPAASSAPGARR